MILKEAIINPEVLDEEGTIVRLVDKYRRFVAKGYYGNQNKGIGWVLTKKENEEIDFDFLRIKNCGSHLHDENPFWRSRDDGISRL